MSQRLGREIHHIVPAMTRIALTAVLLVFLVGTVAFILAAPHEGPVCDPNSPLTGVGCGK